MAILQRLGRMMGYRSGNRGTVPDRTSSRPRCRPALECLEDRSLPSSLGTSAIASNFNGTPIGAGNTIWFSGAFKVSGLHSSPVTLHFTNDTIAFAANGVNYTLPAPNADITLSPTATQATTTFDAATNSYLTTLPMHFSGSAFLDGFALPVTSPLPGGIKNVTWQGQFSSDTPGVSVNWQWAAGVYTNFSSDYNALNVKPVDDNHVSAYQNSDHAGTPEAFLPYVIGGATGGGGSNFTGSLSGTAQVTPTVNQTGSLSGSVTDQATGTGLSGIVVTLTGTNSLGQTVTVTTTSAANGSFSFTGLLAGTYTITETLNPPLQDFQNSVGSLGGATAPGSNQITNILLGAGANGLNYNFGDIFVGS